MNSPVRAAALPYSNEAFDRSVADGTRQWLKERRIDKIYDEEYQPATQDFTSILLVIQVEDSRTRAGDRPRGERAELDSAVAGGGPCRLSGSL